MLQVTIIQYNLVLATYGDAVQCAAIGMSDSDVSLQPDLWLMSHVRGDCLAVGIMLLLQTECVTGLTVHFMCVLSEVCAFVLYF